MNCCEEIRPLKLDDKRLVLLETCFFTMCCSPENTFIPVFPEMYGHNFADHFVKALICLEDYVNNMERVPEVFEIILEFGTLWILFVI